MEQALYNLPYRQGLSTGANLYTEAPQVNCKTCEDRGIVLVKGDGGSDVARVCKCMEQRKLERLFKTSKITPAFQSKTFSNFNLEGIPEAVKGMFECARDYVMKFRALIENNWLVFLGEPGCGKTHLSMAVANNLISKGIGILYFQHVEGMGELKSLLRRSGEKEMLLEDRLNMMKKVDVLVWDDLFKGRASPTEFELERTFEVLNYRYLNLLPTIISSELNEDALYRIDRGIARRIIERGKGHLVIVEGIEANYSLNG